MKVTKILALTLILTLLFGVTGAFAYDYAALGENAGVYVTGEEIVIDDANVTVAGEIASEGGVIRIDGVQMSYRNIGDWTAGNSSASGEASGEASDEAEAAQTGQSGIILRGEEESTKIAIGGEENYFTAPDGREYNTVIELWADDADEENALKPGTTRSLLDNDVETYPGVGLAVVGDTVTIDNSYILTEGANRSALVTSEAMGQYVDTVIRDSTLVSLSEGWILPAFKCIYRAARTALCTSYGSTWMYNTRMYSDTWGNYSMEGANGIEHFYVINAYSESYVGGYGLFTLGMGEDYATGNNYVRVYGSKMVSPQYGWINDDGPNVIVGSMADIADDEHAMDHYDGEITEDMYVTTDGRTLIGGANNALVVCFDMQPFTTLAADITIKNSVLTTAAEDLVGEDGEPIGHLLDLDGASLLNDDAISGGMAYFAEDYVNGAVLWLRGANTDITFDNAELRSQTGVLMHSTIDYSNWSGSNLGGQEAVGYRIAMKDMTVDGDIIHDDYQRGLYVTLDGTQWTGAANYYTCDEFADRISAFLEESWPYAEQSKAEWEAEHGEGSSALGTVEDIYGWLVYDEEYDDSLTALEITLENGAVWNVTGVSHLTKLTIGDGCTVNGVITENADGTVTVSPAETVASGEPSGETPPERPADLAPGEEPPGGFGGID